MPFVLGSGVSRLVCLILYKSLQLSSSLRTPITQAKPIFKLKENYQN